MQTREGNHIDSKLSKIRIELAGKTEISSDIRHDCGNEMVEVSLGRSIEFQCTNADVIQCLIVKAESLTNVITGTERGRALQQWIYNFGEPIGRFRYCPRSPSHSWRYFPVCRSNIH